MVAAADRGMAPTDSGFSTGSTDLARGYLPDPLHQLAPVAPLDAEDASAVGRGMRTSRKARRTGHGRGRLRNMVSIHDRPEQIETRTEVGHWEGDLVMGRCPSAVATLVERTTRIVRLVKLDGIKGPDVRAALVQNLRGMPKSLLRSITWDRGREMSGARTTRPRPRHPRLLLRSSLTVATRLEREHQPAPTPVPGEERRPVPLHSRRTRSDREQDQHTSTPGP